MTQKFDDFRTALVALCVEHGVHLGADGSIDAWDADTSFKPDEIWLEDETKETA